VEAGEATTARSVPACGDDESLGEVPSGRQASTLDVTVTSSSSWAAIMVADLVSMALSENSSKSVLLP
jgi:uncharacterized membrane protein